MTETNEKFSNNKNKVLIICCLITIILSLSGVAFAFFTASITGGIESITANTANLGSLTAEGETISLISPNPSDSMSETTYKVISSSDTTEDRSYTLSLQIDQNTFVNTVEDLQGNSTTQNGQLVIEVTLTSNVETFTFYEDAPDFITFNSSTNVITIDVTDSTTAVADTYQLLKGVIIEAADTQEYDVTFQFKNLSGYNQSDNMGKKFRGGLIIEADKKPDIIPGYTEVAYLQSSGTQYINTGYMVNSSTNYEITAQIISNNSKRDGALMGTRGTNDFIIWYNTNEDKDRPLVVFRTIDSSMPLFYINGFESVDIKYYNGVFTVQNSNSYNVTKLSTTSAYSLYLFALNNSNSPDSRMFLGKVYNLKLFNSEELVKNFLPCIRITDSKPGMCDTVSKTFFANQGTGEFGYETLDGVVVNPT